MSKNSPFHPVFCSYLLNEDELAPCTTCFLTKLPPSSGPRQSTGAIKGRRAPDFPGTVRTSELSVSPCVKDLLNSCCRCAASRRYVSPPLEDFCCESRKASSATAPCAHRALAGEIDASSLEVVLCSTTAASAKTAKAAGRARWAHHHPLPSPGRRRMRGQDTRATIHRPHHPRTLLSRSPTPALLSPRQQSTKPTLSPDFDSWCFFQAGRVGPGPEEG